MKPIERHPNVDNDIAAGIDWYNQQELGLSRRFWVEVQLAYFKIRKYPGAGSFRLKNVRQLPVKRFPYNVIYVERPTAIWIVAVAHTKRRPNYWAKRLKDIP